MNAGDGAAVANGSGTEPVELPGLTAEESAPLPAEEENMVPVEPETVGTKTSPAAAADPAAVAAALVDRAAAVDGVKAIGSHVLDHFDEAEIVLWLNAAGEVIPGSAAPDLNGALGVAIVPAADPAEFVLDPSARGRALGTRLLRETLEHTSAVWAHGDLPAAQALNQKFGMKPVRTLLQLRRPLGVPGDVGAVQWPDGVEMRTFVPGQDDEEIVGVNARAFSWHPEQSRFSLADLHREMGQSWFDPAGFFLAVHAESGRILGFHWTKVHPAGSDQPEPVGEVYVIGVDPLSPIRRLGRPLTLVGLDRMAAQGLSAVMLYVEGDNAPALRLYAGLGFTESRRDVVYRRG